MPENGWSVLTVREHTAKTIKKMAKDRGLTVDELVNELVNPATARQEWSICKACGAKVKTVNLQEHMYKVHPKPLTVKEHTLS
jgi:hypothetical protein